MEIYLDYAATTPLDPLVLDAMLPFLRETFGNASSIHRFGRAARAAMDTAREHLAALLNADFAEIYFTGSGTEADNLALFGVMQGAQNGRNDVVVSVIEHHAVLHPAHALQTMGYAVHVVPVDSNGSINITALDEAISDKTALVSIMHANNEIGTVQPIAEIARLAHERGALFHTDAVQTAGILPVDVKEIGCDLLTVCAHKMYGPKGVGALFVRQGLKVAPQIHGGAQEREKRAGTENIAALVGFGKAAELAQERKATDAEQLTRQRDGFLTQIREVMPDVRLNGHPTQRLPNNVNVSVEGVEGPTLLMNLDRHGIAASSGSACSSGSIEPSHVLKAIGLTDALASSGVRFSLGRTTTDGELTQAAQVFGNIVEKMRKNR